MHRELFDLLQEAKAGAPPPRYDVEDVVAAGRHRQRRRRAGLAIAAVTAVAVAIGVPQIVTRGAARPRPAPPVATPSVITPTATTPAVRAFNYLFRGYTAGGYRVYDPAMVEIGWQDAAVEKIGTNMHRNIDAMLRVYDSGVGLGGEFDAATLVDATPIHGRSAFFARPAPGDPASGGPERLIWQYDAAAYAVLTPTEDALPRQVLQKIAAGLTVGDARPVTVPFQAAYLPAGHLLARAGGDGWAMFAPADAVRASLARPVGGLASAQGAVPRYLSITVISASADTGGASKPTTATCVADGHSCFRWVARARERYRVMVESPDTSEAETRKILAGITMTNPGDRSTWIPVNEAFPASVQLSGD